MERLSHDDSVKVLALEKPFIESVGETLYNHSTEITALALGALAVYKLSKIEAANAIADKLIPKVELSPPTYRMSEKEVIQVFDSVPSSDLLRACEKTICTAPSNTLNFETLNSLLAQSKQRANHLKD